MKRLFTLVLLVACGTGSTDDKLIEQSLYAHDSAMKSAKSAEKHIEKISSRISHCGDSIRLVISDSLPVLVQDLAYWESTITEIPGHEHNHHHGHDHSHDHSAPPNLTPQMILDIQNDLKERAERLKKRAIMLGEITKGCVIREE